jgi:NADPH:quinone reductase-like Zn-dependent oxidoreductase
MKAIICTRYGPPEVMQIKEVEKPVPKNDEVCIKIHSAAVTASDIFMHGDHIPYQNLIRMRMKIGITKPRKSIPGLVLAGEIESAGKKIKRFKPGDQVFGLTGFGFGAYAEYKCMKETDSDNGCLALKPANLSYGESTVVAYGGILALQYLGKGKIQRGQKVLIYGASGTTGTMAVQLARYLGAEVTGVCSTVNLELVKSLGAARVIDYTRVDSLNPDEHFDFILDAVGKTKTSKLKEACKIALAPKGKYISIDDGNLEFLSERLMMLKKLAEAGCFMPFIDRTYHLDQIVEAHKYVNIGHKKGGVVINIRNNQVNHLLLNQSIGHILL